jgi:branched-chain amino acid transport system permease protein
MTSLAMPRQHLAGALAAIVVLAALLLLPGITSAYTLSLTMSVLEYVVLATAWAMFSGPTRYVSLASAAFFGIGAYTTALTAKLLPFSLVLVVAGSAGFAVALVIGLSTLRLSGLYFVIFTFGLSELLRQLANWVQINVTKTRVQYIFIKTGPHELYYYLVGLCTLTFLCYYLLRRSRLGFALRVIGEDETVATHSGINATVVKVFVFAISAVFMSLVGAIIAPRWTYIDPNIAINSLVSFQVVIMALLGGIMPLFGPAVGAVLLVLLSEYLASSFPYRFNVALGLCFIVIVYFLPTGLAGLAERIDANLRRRFAWRASP